MYLLNQSKNKNALKYLWLFGNKLCPYDNKASVIHELCSAIMSTKESLKAKNMNPNHFVTRKKERKDLCQMLHIHVNEGRASVTWSGKGFKFWSRTCIGVVKLYKVRELNKLKGFECSRVTVKYESPNRYYLLIPVIVNKKKRMKRKM